MFTAKVADIKSMHRATVEGIDDMIMLTELHESSLLHNLRVRYLQDKIYVRARALASARACVPAPRSPGGRAGAGRGGARRGRACTHRQTYTGTILVAVNPYKDIPSLYGMDAVRRYEGRMIGDLPPHIFAIGNATYTSLRRSGKNQCVVIRYGPGPRGGGDAQGGLVALARPISDAVGPPPRRRLGGPHAVPSGESGAGKTESTKLILQNFTALSSKHSLIQEQIIEASPIMEAFGNAKTVRNDNSSRFGKFIEVQFGPDGTIQGARILDYLLERSRIVHQSTDERNYHIFYCLITGATSAERSALRLSDAQNFAYLNQSGCIKVPKIDDAADFEKVRSAMKLLKFGDHERGIFEVLASVLHIGNLTFRKVENANVAGDACDFVDKAGPCTLRGRASKVL